MPVQPPLVAAAARIPSQCPDSEATRRDSPAPADHDDHRIMSRRGPSHGATPTVTAGQAEAAPGPGQGPPAAGSLRPGPGDTEPTSRVSGRCSDSESEFCRRRDGQWLHSATVTVSSSLSLSHSAARASGWHHDDHDSDVTARRRSLRHGDGPRSQCQLEVTVTAVTSES